MDTEALENSLGAMMLDFHRHLVYPTNTLSECDACYESKQIAGGEGGYMCKPCNLYVHKDCVEINNLYRHKHPLKLLEFISLRDDEKTCFLCETKMKYEPLFYHCPMCNLTLCIICTSNPLIINVRKKVHKHSLTQVMIHVSFTCDACGLYSHGLPCICLQCCFIIHRSCIRLPQVIHINRHNHRVMHTYLLGPGDWVCGVCLKDINRLYGAYSCSICRYVVHSKCATRDDVWDRKELKDVPEDETQDLDPFKVISDRLIKHFSHEHDLRLVTSGNNERCYACSLPIFYDPYYFCMQCHFILHETCANLPRLKRHELHKSPFTLYPNPKPREIFASGRNFFECFACHRPSTGFRYKSGAVELDVRCATISDKFLHGSHPHSLFIPSTTTRVCLACDDSVNGILTCVECIDFFLCFKCATIPNEVFHKYDTHMLYLRFCENLYGNDYWCEICEKPTNPKKWFYSCDKCGSTFHINCVLGIAPYVKPGQLLDFYGWKYEVVSNNNLSRPFCDDCSLRCEDAFVLKSKGDEDVTSFLCSIYCLKSFVLSFKFF